MPPLLTKSTAGKVLYRADLASCAFIKRGEIGWVIIYRLQGYGRYTSHSPCALCYALQFWGLLAPIPPLIVGRGSGLHACRIKRKARFAINAPDVTPSASGATRPRTPANRWQRLRAPRLSHSTQSTLCDKCDRRYTLRIGGYSPPYPR